MLYPDRLLAPLVLAVLLLGLIPLSVAQGYSYQSNAFTLELSPDNTTIPDSGVLRIRLEVNISSADQYVPVADFLWVLSFHDPQLFNLSAASAEGYYLDPENRSYPIQVSTSVREGSLLDVDVYLGSVEVPSVLIMVEVSVPARAVVTGPLGTVVEHSIGGAIGSNAAVQLLSFANTTVYIVHEPPSLTVEVEPSLGGRGLGAPGTLFNITVSAQDPSGVANLSLRIVGSNGSEVWSYAIPSSSTGNATSYSATVTWNSAGVDEGNYTVVVEAFDTLGIEPSRATAAVELRRGFTVPTDFPTITSALSYPGLLNGSVIYVKGRVEEPSSVAVVKRVSIVGVGDAEVVFSGTGFGFILLSPAEVGSLRISGASTAFRIVNTSGVRLEGVDAVATRFLEVEAPYTSEYWNHTVVQCTLNGSAVAYLIGGGELRGTYAEAHLAFGSYSIESAEVGYLHLVNTTALLNTSSIGTLEAVGSSATGYDTAVSTWIGVESSYTGYATLLVRVTFAGKPVSRAHVVARNSLGAVEATTGSDGYALLRPVTEVCSAGCAINRSAFVEAVYKGLRSSSSVDLTHTPIAIEIALPVPSLEVGVRGPWGEPVTGLAPGTLVQVNASFDLKGFTGRAVLRIELLSGGSAIGSIEVLVTGMGSGGILAYLFTPFEESVYSIRAVLNLEGLPEVAVSWPS